MDGTASTITSDADNVAAVIDAWKLMVGRMPRHKIEQAGGVATMFGHEPLSFLNVSVLDRPLSEAGAFSAALALAHARARACAHPSMLGLCAAWAPANWQDLAAAAGLTLALNMTGMAAGALDPARRAPPALDYRLAADVATATDLAMINAHAYGMPTREFECLCNLHLWREQSFGVVGYVGGRAVTCTAAFVMTDMIYIALVATMPDAHGQGYAEAVMRRAIAYAQEAGGERRLWLHASDMGAPLYASMGFQTGAALPLLTFADGAAAH